MENRKKILLGQLGSNGDCLYATTVARQIKHDYPTCHLTWAIGSMYRSILDGNPYIDQVWEIPLTEHANIVNAWHILESEARRRKKRGDFDEVFITQIEPARCDGTIRSSTFSGYPRPITVPVSPVLRLSETEVDNVRRFAEAHRLSDRGNVILFECSPKSGQSFVTPDFAVEVAEKIIDKFPDTCIILSANVSIRSINERIIDGNVLSLRENAELTKYCSLLIGGSSGITWISTSDWAKPLPMIQLINPDALWFASVAYDHEYWNLPTDFLIEMKPCPPEKIFKCFDSIINQGFQAAKIQFNERILPNFKCYKQFQYDLLLNYKFKDAYCILECTSRRNGFRSEFILWLIINSIKFILKKLVPPVFIDIVISLKNMLRSLLSPFKKGFLDL
jgi:ADP-heptose:LPS heptosyltransferase